MFSSLFNTSTTIVTSLNPWISSDCDTGLWSHMSSDGYVQVCVEAVTGVSTTASPSTITPSSTTSVSTDSSVTAPGPTQTGIAANCNKYYIAQCELYHIKSPFNNSHFPLSDGRCPKLTNCTAGDSCEAVQSMFGITGAQFHAWNPAVSADCASGFWVDEAYCVGVSGDSTSSMTTVTAPGPTQSGISSNCNKYYVAKGELFCFPYIHSFFPSLLFHGGSSNGIKLTITCSG